MSPTAAHESGSFAPAPAVLLLGHGSHLDAASSRPVRDLAERLRRSMPGSEVRIGFWKEEPELRHALLLVERRRVVAVPVFTSAGYFTDRVVPRELGVEPPLSVTAGGHRVRYTPPVGGHPRMARVVLERAREPLDERGGEPGETTLVVLGHGTERHPASGDAVRRLAGELKRRSGYADVRAAFLDEEPRMVPALEAVTTPRAVVVPFFVSAGWHVGTTIPRDLGLEEGRGRVDETAVDYTAPVGTHPATVRVVEALVGEAVEAGFGGAPPGAPAAEPPAARARRDFLGWIDGAGAGGRTFLQTRVRATGAGRYRIRHVDDRHRDPAGLRRHTDPAAAERIAARTAAGGHRSLRTAPDLAPGWLLDGLSARGVWEAYARLYPVAPVQWHLERTGELHVTSYREAAGRQTGIYARVDELSADEVEDAKRACCAPESCLRRVRWDFGEGRGGEGAGDVAGELPESVADDGASDPRPAPDPDALVPCPEACSILLTRARDILEERGAGG